MNNSPSTEEWALRLKAQDAELQRVTAERDRYKAALADIRNKSILWRRGEGDDRLREAHGIAQEALDEQA